MASGAVRQVWHGLARFDRVGYGRSVQARFGGAWWGKAGMGAFGWVRRGMAGKFRERSWKFKRQKHLQQNENY